MTSAVKSLCVKSPHLTGFFTCDFHWMGQCKLLLSQSILRKGEFFSFRRWLAPQITRVATAAAMFRTGWDFIVISKQLFPRATVSPPQQGERNCISTIKEQCAARSLTGWNYSFLYLLPSRKNPFPSRKRPFLGQSQFARTGLAGGHDIRQSHVRMWSLTAWPSNVHLWLHLTAITGPQHVELWITPELFGVTVFGYRQAAVHAKNCRPEKEAPVLLL